MQRPIVYNIQKLSKSYPNMEKPANIITAALGALFLDISLSVSPFILLVIPLCAVPLAGIGAIIGIRGRTPQESDSVNLLLTLILAGLGPVVIPPERLPDWLILVGRFLDWRQR